MGATDYWLNKRRILLFSRLLVALYLAGLIAWLLAVTWLADTPITSLRNDFAGFWSIGHLVLQDRASEAYLPPIALAGHARKNNSNSLPSGTPSSAAICSIGFPGRTAGLTTTRSARRKSSSRCPPRWNEAIVSPRNWANESAKAVSSARSVTVTTAPCRASHRAAATPPPK